ncbi:MAG: AAA family ATPase, partial [Chloroflexota bacterium]
DSSRDKEGFGHGQGYLYPHAFREHWVGQQYLPAALQGRLFYQPGDQGHERQIAEQVARRREEQLAAMVETAVQSPTEVLTTSPTDRARDAWLQRTIANSGRNLGHLRDRLFELAAVQRHHLILDLNAGTGLLTWEAMRRAPEGGVWAMTADAQAAEALRQQAARLPEVERPVILIGRPDELDYLLSLRGEGEVRFDRIIGRNPLTFHDSASALLRQLANRLLPAGRLVLTQIIPRRSQRLYDLIDWHSEELKHRVVAAEEKIYSDPVDSLVNWDTTELEAVLKAAGFTDVQIQVESQVEERRITAAHLSRWFGEGLEDGRPSYGQRLRAAGLSPDQVEQVAALYRRHLLDQSVSWQSSLAYVTAGKSHAKAQRW